MTPKAPKIIHVQSDPPPAPEQDAAAVPAASTSGALAKSWTDTSIQPGRNGDIMDSVPRTMNVDGVAAQVNPASGDPAAENRWRAMAGSDLRDILTIWSQQKNVKLVWQTNKDFSVRQSVTEQGTFRNAVVDVLNQYQGQDGAPVGNLYKDQASGQTVLLIRENNATQ